jgi:hypothetical protein
MGIRIGLRNAGRILVPVIILDHALVRGHGLVVHIRVHVLVGLYQATRIRIVSVTGHPVGVVHIAGVASVAGSVSVVISPTTCHEHGKGQTQDQN